MRQARQRQQRIDTLTDVIILYLPRSIVPAAAAAVARCCCCPTTALLITPLLVAVRRPPIAVRAPVSLIPVLASQPLLLQLLKEPPVPPLLGTARVWVVAGRQLGCCHAPAGACGRDSTTAGLRVCVFVCMDT